MKETLQSLLRRFQTVRAEWPKVPDTGSPREEVWYTGLAVSPAEFSQQLSSLQISLQRECVPVSAVPVKNQTALH
jgi:hypothetical protein